MAASLYIIFVALAGLSAALSWWVVAAICGVLALTVAYRYEVRWLTDKATGSRPRPVPAHAKHLRTTKRG